MSYEHELKIALEAASLAGRAILEEYHRFEAIPDAAANITTHVDRQAQEIILQHLRRAFSQDALCAEETTPTLSQAAHTGGRLWIVDPIDGTRGFARKNGEFSVMVGLVEQGHIAVGAVFEPVPNRLTYASRHGGCWRQDGNDASPTACRVSTVADLSRSSLVQSHSKDPSVPSRPVKAMNPSRVVETYSAGVKLARVARGEVDLYVNTYKAFHDWDTCAGQILVEESGGQVTGLGGQTLVYGTPGNWQRHGLLATNSLLHPTALQALHGVEG